MNRYVSHHFAHEETLDRAERWLRQRGFRPEQIETHREGVPRITVVCDAERAAEAEMILKAAETGDPEGWPSLWDEARMPHPHLATQVPDATDTVVFTVHPSPIAWHPLDAHHSPSELSDAWDVKTRFS